MPAAPDLYRMEPSVAALLAKATLEKGKDSAALPRKYAR